MNRPLRILLIEDNPGDAELVRQVARDPIQRGEFTLDHVTRLADGTEILARGAADLVLLDLSLPDADGLYTVEAVRAASPETPIVVLSGVEDEELAMAAVQTGAQDFLVKGGVAPEQLFRSIRYARERKRAEEELRRTAEELRILDNLIEQTIQPLVLSDFDGRLIRFNRAFERLTGYEADDLGRLDHRDLTPERWHVVDDRMRSRLEADGKAVRYEKECLRCDGRGHRRRARHGPLPELRRRRRVPLRLLHRHHRAQAHGGRAAGQRGALRAGHPGHPGRVVGLGSQAQRGLLLAPLEGDAGLRGGRAHQLALGVAGAGPPRGPGRLRPGLRRPHRGADPPGGDRAPGRPP